MGRTNSRYVVVLGCSSLAGTSGLGNFCGKCLWIIAIGPTTCRSRCQRHMLEEELFRTTSAAEVGLAEEDVPYNTWLVPAMVNSSPRKPLCRSG